MDNNGEIDRFFAGLLRGEDASWPSRWRGSQIFDEIIGRVIFHGVAGLVLRRTPDIANWPSYVVNGIRSEALSQTMWELRHHSVLGSLIENLAHCGIASVVMKGTALAYARYDEPALRRRSDTDLLVQKADLRATRLVLKDLGFRNSEHTRTIFGNMYYQESWHLAHVDGTNHEIDLHWEVTNSRALSAVLNAAECLSKAVPLPRLSKSARSTDSVTQLIQCSLNRAIHGKTGYYSNS